MFVKRSLLVPAVNVRPDMSKDKIVQKFSDASLVNMGAKGKRKFERLTKADKRAWRDALQRAISGAQRDLGKALAGQKLSQKARNKIDRANRRAAKQLLCSPWLGDEIELQTGAEFAYGALFGGAVSAIPTLSLTKSLSRMSQRVEGAIATVTGQVEEVADQAKVCLGSIKDAGDTIASEVRPVVEKVDSVADALFSSANSTAVTADHASGFMAELRQAFSGFLSSLSVVTGVMKRLACAALVWWICSYYNVGLITTTFLALLASVAPDAALLIRKWVCGAELQSGLDDCASVATLFLTCWMPGSKDTGYLAGDFMRRVSTFPRAKDGISKFLESILELFERFVNFVLRRSDDNMVRFITKNDVFSKWCNKTSEYLKFLATNTESIGITKILEIRDHYVTGMGLYEHLHERDAQEKWKFLSSKLGLALEPHQGAITASHNLRAMPVWAQFAGPSGVGKTSLIKSVASIALWVSGEVAPKEALANIWQKGTTEYWNGYVGQKCLVVDDAFQVKPRQGEPDSEAMQFIRAVGNFAYPLNFADVTSKGRWYLNTPLILSTTNAKNIVAEWEPYITCPDALARRIQHGYWVSVNKEWRDKYDRLDYVKFQSYIDSKVAALLSKVDQVIMPDEVIDVVPWHAWEVRKHAFDSSMITTEVYAPGMRDVVCQIAQQLRDRRESHVKELSTFDNWTSLMDKVKFDLQDGTDEVFHDPTGDTEAWIMDTVREIVPKTDLISLGAETPRATPRYADLLDEGDLWCKPQYVTSDEPQQMRVQEPVGRLDWCYDKMKQTAEVCRRLKDDLATWAQEWASKLLGPDIAKTILATAGLVGVLLLSYKIVKSAIRGAATVVSHLLELIGVKPTQLQEQSGEGVASSKPRKVNYNLPTRLIRSDGLQLQVGVPPQEGGFDKVYDNVFKVVIEGDTDEVVLGHFTGLGSNVFIFNKHFLNALEQMDQSRIMRFYHSTSSYQLAIPIHQFLAFDRLVTPDHDIAGVAMNVASIKVSKNILNKFLREEDLRKVFKSTNLPCRLDVCDVKRKKGEVQKHHVSYNSMGFEYLDADLGTTKGVVLRGLIKYRMNTKSGDCGGLVCLSENRHYGGKCILGLHSAGLAKTLVREGFATVVSKEVATEIFTQLASYTEKPFGVTTSVIPSVAEKTGVVDATPEECAELQGAGLTGGSVYLLGKLVEPINIAASTSLNVSVMQEEELLGPAPTAPAVLRPVVKGDEVKIPMVEGTRAYQSEVIFDETDKLVPILDVAFSRHRRETKGMYRGILTFHEAIVPPEFLKLKTINVRTSPGYKYRQFVTPSTPGKTYFFGTSDDWTQDYMTRQPVSLLESDVESIVVDARNGVRQLHLCTDFLKDELRPLAKVENVQTRVISGTPLDYSLAVRMYFGSFLAATFASRIENGMAPGINHYTEWGELAAALIGPGRTKFFDGDFSRFDSSEQPWIHNAILRYINEWYREGEDWQPEHDEIRRVLWLDLIHSRHIVGLGHQLTHVVQWNKSLPSGHPLTTLVNSMYSLICLVVCYVKTTGNLDFWDHAFANTFGDDNIVSVDDEVCDLFNQVTVSDKMKDMGLVYTAGRKGAELEPFTSLENVTFLKRSFARDEDDDSLIRQRGGLDLGLEIDGYRWIGPLDPASFLYEGYWFKNKKDPWGDMSRRVEHLLAELALHPQSMWEEHFPKIRDFMIRHGLPMPFDTRHQARVHIKTRFDVWF